MGMAGHARLDARAEISGMGDPTLTRAIVRYRGTQAVDGAEAQADDVGVALVVDGEYPATAEAIDLGSGRVRHLDLATEVVVLDWVYPSTLDYVRMLVRTAGALDDTTVEGEFARSVRRYCHDILLGVLGRIGLDPLTRPAFVRLGFRDIVRDLDPNERAVVRIAVERNARLEVGVDEDDNTLIVERIGAVVDDDLERVLASSFPSGRIRRDSASGRALHRVGYPLPWSFEALREQIDEIRCGLLALCSCFEPDRHRTTCNALDVFGPRDTLVQLDRPITLPPAPSPLSGSSRVAAGVA